MESLFLKLRTVILPFAVAAAAMVALSLGVLLVIDPGSSGTGDLAGNPTQTPAVLGDSETPEAEPSP